MTALWHDIRMLHALANVLMMAAFTAFVATALSWTIHRPVFELDGVDVVSQDERPFQHITLATLRSFDLGRFDGNFFTIDLQAVRRSFESVPWVRHAQVRRIWPNQLRVTLEEREPLARWASGGLVDVHGEWFDPAPGHRRSLADLASIQFAGPEGSQSLVRSRFEELRRELKPIGLAPVAVRLSDRQSWSSTLSNGLELEMGRETDVPILERLTRWIALYKALEIRLQGEMKVVDLRYPNGFAVRAPGALEQNQRNAAREALKKP